MHISVRQFQRRDLHRELQPQLRSAPRPRFFPDVDPRAFVADKGYDAKTNREAARKRGICPVIPYRSNTIDKPKFFAKVLYKARARIEQMMGKIKRFKRIALRCEKTATNYASFLALVCGFILIKSVHTA